MQDPAPHLLPGSSERWAKPLATRPSAPDSHPLTEDLRALRHLLAITIIAGLTLGLVLWTAAEHFGAWLDARVAPTLPRCSDEADCEGGRLCHDGYCINAPSGGPLPQCGPGDACELADAECQCAAPMSCTDHACAPPPLAAAACEKPEIQRLLAGLAVQCAGDYFTCPESKIEDYLLSSEAFDQLLAEFPDTVTIHFESGKPPRGAGREWPPKEVEEHYLSRLGEADTRRALQQANLILLVARASGGARSASEIESNYQYARLRAHEAKRLIERLGDAPAAISALSAKIKPVNLGASRALDPEIFYKNYRNRRITWSELADSAFARALDAYSQLSSKDQRAWREIVNQVVVIVPITCALPSGDSPKAP